MRLLLLMPCQCCTPKQIDLTSILLLYSCLIVSSCYCKQADVNQHLYNIATNIIIIWRLCNIFQDINKPLFIIHLRVKGLLKATLKYKNEAPQLKKWAWHMHNKIA